MLLILQNIYNGNQLKDCGLKMGSCTFEVNFILQSVIKILTAAITYPKYVIAVEPFWSIGYRAGLGKGESKCKRGPDLCFQGYLAGSLTCLGSCFLGQGLGIGLLPGCWGRIRVWTVPPSGCGATLKTSRVLACPCRTQCGQLLWSALPEAIKLLLKNKEGKTPTTFFWRILKASWSSASRYGFTGP